MKGTRAYEEKYRKRAEKLIKDNSDKPYLAGFYYFNEAADSTACKYLEYCLNFMNATGKKPKELVLEDFTKYLHSIKDTSSPYRIAVYSALKKFSYYLKASGENDKNYMQFVKRPKAVESKETKTKRDKGFLEENEIDQLLEGVERGVGTTRSRALQKKWRERDILIILLFLSTGMRCSALYKLDLNSINMSTHMLTTNDKGDKEHEHKLPDEVMCHLEAWLAKRKELLNGKEEDALFISNQRSRMDQSSIFRIVKKYAAVIQDKNISPHKLRATYGTQLYNATGDLRFVQDRLGHSNPKTTEIYIRGQKNVDIEKETDIISNLLKK